MLVGLTGLIRVLAIPMVCFGVPRRVIASTGQVGTMPLIAKKYRVIAGLCGSSRIDREPTGKRA